MFLFLFYVILESIRLNWSLTFLQLARFVDSILKKSQRNLSESELEEKMADIVSKKTEVHKMPCSAYVVR